MGLRSPAALPVVDAILLSRQGARPARDYYHQGTDWGHVLGTPVFAVNGAAVEFVEETGGPYRYGNVVVLRHADDLLTLYAHLDRIFVRQGQQVAMNQVIGTLGATFGSPEDPGRTMAVPHLHLEVLRQWPVGYRNRDARYDVLRELAAAGLVLDGAKLAYGEPRDYHEPALLAVAKSAGGEGPADQHPVVAPRELVYGPPLRARDLIVPGLAVLATLGMFVAAAAAPWERRRRPPPALRLAA